jgi:rhodanese-related sulfurtransferase
VAEKLERLGFGKAYALVGGLDAWKAEGLPLAPKGSEEVATASYPLDG